jgi:alpha-amylase
MMGKVCLLLGIHNHQPVGNFDHVFREAHDRCYRPFLDLLREYPDLRISLHYSGPLMDWLEKHQPTFLDELKSLVNQRQVELLTGGYYEPILTAIPARDGVGQVTMMSRYLKERLEADPTGLWLAERVWDTSLPKLLGSCGVAYTLVDDSHFQLVGVKPETLRGYYLTEHEGIPLAIFPISKRLRYLIPFRQPEETIQYLDQLKEQGPIGITYADDGEKFGLWPGTYRWVYDQGWLKRFFDLLQQNRSWITTQTFGEYLAQTPPTGRIYLPTASYEEMMEWALPTEAILEREALLEKLEAAGLKEAAQDFLRGGLWHNFLVKYPEINLMHKKMLYVSDQLSLQATKRGSRSKGFTEAQRELYQAQGNDAYWHGLFGGYYLNYLRHAVYEHLLKAENLIASGPSESKIRLIEMDLDRDGYIELLAQTPWLNLYLKPNDGATGLQIDYRPKALCLTHVPMRRREAYHKRLQEKRLALPAKSEKLETIPSIHEIVSVKEAGLDRKLIYDRYPRWSFRDHLLEFHTTLANYEAGQYEDLGGFSNQPYERVATRSGQDEAVVSFQRIGMLKDIALAVKKDYTLWASQARLSLKYAFHHPQPSTHPIQPTPYQWGVELNLTLLAGSDPKRYYRFPGKSVQDVRLCSLGVVEQVTEVDLMDDWHGIEIHLCYDPPVRLWRFPVETVSQSEEGMETTYQGSCLVALWPLNLPVLRVREGLLTLSIIER